MWGCIKHRAPSKHQYAGSIREACGDGYEECGAELQKSEKGRRCGKKVEEDGGWVKKIGRSKACATGEDGKSEGSGRVRP